MISKTKEVFYCEFCNKNGLHKGHMRRHEQTCSKNPKNKRPCFDCVYLDMIKTTAIREWCNDEFGTREVEVYYCRELNIFLHTPKTEVKGNKHELEKGNNEPMPKECSSFSNDIADFLF